MTREQAKQSLISLGVSEPTDDNITNYLNTVNSEVKKEKDRADKLKAEMESLQESATNVEELQKKIEEIEQSKMTETEKIANELAKANQRVADLEKAAAIQNQRAAAAEKFKVTAEQAKQIVKDDGSFDYDVLGQIISEKETNAVSEYEKQKLAETQNPSGASGNGDGKSSAVKLVERHFGGQKQNNDVLSHYLNGGN